MTEPLEPILFPLKGPSGPFQRVKEKGLVFLRENRDPIDFNPFPHYTCESIGGIDRDKSQCRFKNVSSFYDPEWVSDTGVNGPTTTTTINEFRVLVKSVVNQLSRPRKNSSVTLGKTGFHLDIRGRSSFLDLRPQSP